MQQYVFRQVCVCKCVVLCVCVRCVCRFAQAITLCLQVCELVCVSVNQNAFVQPSEHFFWCLNALLLQLNLVLGHFFTCKTCEKACWCGQVCVLLCVYACVQLRIRESLCMAFELFLVLKCFCNSRVKKDPYNIPLYPNGVQPIETKTKDGFFCWWSPFRKSYGISNQKRIGHSIFFDN